MTANAPESRADPWWADRRARPLAVLGVIMVASGIAHLPVWALLGGPWEGPVTWRKPILFGISGGLTAISLGWVWSMLAWRRGDVPLAAATAWALFVEVLLIDLQRWRGVGSHFNRDTPLDSFLFDAMGVLIVGVTLVIAELTRRLVLQRPAVAADMLLAARAGMVLLVVSCLLGIWVGMHGETRLEQGLDPTRLGAAGVPKFPHGVVIHAVQWLPALAWIARRTGIAEPVRWWLVAMASVGSTLLLVYALVQTALGRPRFDVVPATAAVLVVALAGLGVPVVSTTWSWLRGRRSPPPAAGRIV
ncbi:MAG: hypothetical protein KJS77_08810 [Planctomycetes bacterium]|nr:hypothetical protein [Planctomycetota bacterium]